MFAGQNSSRIPKNHRIITRVLSFVFRSAIELILPISVKSGHSEVFHISLKISPVKVENNTSGVQSIRWMDWSYRKLHSRKHWAFHCSQHSEVNPSIDWWNKVFNFRTRYVRKFISSICISTWQPITSINWFALPGSTFSLIAFLSLSIWASWQPSLMTKWSVISSYSRRLLLFCCLLMREETMRLSTSEVIRTIKQFKQ